ncbi:MAG TPA: AEC family transporter, partial [Mesotoga infera]|nr:AEC family transporter [Mesotoga infera]
MFDSLVCWFIILLMTEIVSKVLTFFVLIGIGFILRRTNLVDD